MSSQLTEKTPESPYASPELLTQMVGHLERGLGRKQLMAIVAMWALIACTGLYLQTKENTIRVKHNVEVVSKDGERVYTVKYEDAAASMTIRLCAEGDDLPLVPGMIIEPFHYIQRKDCVLINSDTFVDWKRNGRKDVVDRNGKILFAKGS